MRTELLLNNIIEWDHLDYIKQLLGPWQLSAIDVEQFFFAATLQNTVGN
jgi:hypothetical protein